MEPQPAGLAINVSIAQLHVWKEVALVLQPGHCWLPRRYAADIEQQRRMNTQRPRTIDAELAQQLATMAVERGVGNRQALRYRLQR